MEGVEDGNLQPGLEKSWIFFMVELASDKMLVEL